MREGSCMARWLSKVQLWTSEFGGRFSLPSSLPFEFQREQLLRACHYHIITGREAFGYEPPGIGGMFQRDLDSRESLAPGAMKINPACAFCPHHGLARDDDAGH